MARAFILVLDSLGIGASPDAGDFGEGIRFQAGVRCGVRGQDRRAGNPAGSTRD